MTSRFYDRMRQEKAAAVSAVAIMAIVFALQAPQSAEAQTYSIIHAFTGGMDGGYARGPLVEGPDGQLYGAASAGGKYLDGNVFKMTKNGKETVLNSFAYWDGVAPVPNLILEPSGTIYGAANQGGDNGDDGTFYELTGRKETVIHQFPYNLPTDGYNPQGPMAVDAQGNFYGATQNGGTDNVGTIYKMDASGNETVLYSFSPGSVSGGDPGGLVMGPDGDLYGAAGCSYSCYSGGGTVFKTDTSGNLTTFFAFDGNSGGNLPSGELLFDAKGNIYGTTYFGGNGPCNEYGITGCGVVFELTPDGTESILYNFQGGADGMYPAGGVIADAKGNLYGTTSTGGNLGSACTEAGGTGCGVVFKLSPKGQETVLHTFEGGTMDGSSPQGDLLLSKHVLYGVANSGAVVNQYGYGAVFKIDLKK